MAKFFLSLLLATMVIAGCVMLADANNHLEKPTFFEPTLLLLFFTTSIIYVYLYKAQRSLFTQLYLLTMVVKVIAYSVYNLIMVLKDKPSAFNNVIFFMLTYFIFTGLEIGFLYSKISGPKRP